MRRWFDPLRIRVDDTAATVWVAFPHALFRSWFMSGPRKTFEQHAAPLISHPVAYEIPGSASSRHGCMPGALSGLARQKTEDVPGKTFSRRHTDIVENSGQQTFGNFLANRKNDFPLAAARELAKGNAPTTYIPFVVYGPSGSGKTHLLRAVVHSLRKRHLTETVYGDAKTIFSGQAPVANVAIDDLQRISPSFRHQEQAVWLMDAAAAQGCLVVASMDAHPLTCQGLSHGLRQRLTAGLVVELKKPDLDIRRQYTQRKNTALELALTKEEIFSLARTYQDFRVIDGVLNKILAYRTLTGKPVTDITQILGFSAAPQALTPAAVLEQVAAHYAVPAEELPGTSKKKNVMRARQVAVFLCRELLGLSLAQLGHIFGNRDHSSIAYTVKKIKQLQQSNKDMHNTVSQLKKMCLFQ